MHDVNIEETMLELQF